jgi:hypothetical protein
MRKEEMTELAEIPATERANLSHPHKNLLPAQIWRFFCRRTDFLDNEIWSLDSGIEFKANTS